MSYLCYLKGIYAKIFVCTKYKMSGITKTVTVKMRRAQIRDRERETEAVVNKRVSLRATQKGYTISLIALALIFNEKH